MTGISSVNCFVDTNIFVYAWDATEPVKQAMAHQWLEKLWQQRSGKVSYQVLQEYFLNRDPETVAGTVDSGSA